MHEPMSNNERPREDREEDSDGGGSEDAPLYVCLQFIHPSFFLTTGQDRLGELNVSVTQAKLKFSQSVEATSSEGLLVFEFGQY